VSAGLQCLCFYGQLDEVLKRKVAEIFFKQQNRALVAISAFGYRSDDLEIILAIYIGPLDTIV